jgi:hypothetical protein
MTSTAYEVTQHNAMKERSAQPDRVAANTLRPGVKVTFKPRKTNTVLIGTVKKVANKTVTVENCSDSRNWCVLSELVEVL